MPVSSRQLGIPGTTQTYSSGEIALILATIRTQESGSPLGNYTIPTSGGSDACGAYQYISSTWQAMFDRAMMAGFVPAGTPKTARACESPKSVQDAVATYDVISFLDSVGGDVTQVPKHWYYPASVGNTNYDNYTPAGNNISIGQYQANWMKTYAGLSKDPALATLTGAFSQDATLTKFNPMNILSPITGLGSILGIDVWSPIKNEFIYFGEIVGGFALLVLGVIIVLVDTGTLSKMPMPVPIPV